MKELFLRYAPSHPPAPLLLTSHMPSTLSKSRASFISALPSAERAPLPGHMHARCTNASLSPTPCSGQKAQEAQYESYDARVQRQALQPLIQKPVYTLPYVPMLLCQHGESTTVPPLVGPPHQAPPRRRPGAAIHRPSQFHRWSQITQVPLDDNAELEFCAWLRNPNPLARLQCKVRIGARKLVLRPTFPGFPTRVRILPQARFQSSSACVVCPDPWEGVSVVGACQWMMNRRASAGG